MECVEVGWEGGAVTFCADAGIGVGSEWESAAAACE